LSQDIEFLAPIAPLFACPGIAGVEKRMGFKEITQGDFA